MSKQLYIYWHPGDKQPEDLSGWEWDHHTVIGGRVEAEWKTVSSCASPFNGTLRKAITAEEYRAHHSMKAWPCECPEGYEVVDFRDVFSETGELTLTFSGSVEKMYTLSYPRPILRKIEPELPPIDEDTVLTNKIEVKAINNSWYDISICFIGHTVKDYAEKHQHYGKILFRYIDQPDTEFTYTKPIEWVTPTDEDARHRPEVEVDGGLGWSQKVLVLVIEDCTGECRYMTMCGSSFSECRMDAKQREGWQ